MTTAGFPHSEICGSMAICAYPQLIAACHVLHRLLMPRHSPCALVRLTFFGSPFSGKLYESFFRYLFTLYYGKTQYFFSLRVIWFSRYNLEKFPSLVGLGGLEPPTSRLSGVRSSLLSYKPLSRSWSLLPPSPSGGDEENRTPDPLLARQVLSQLSYTPV